MIIVLTVLTIACGAPTNKSASYWTTMRFGITSLLLLLSLVHASSNKDTKSYHVRTFSTQDLISGETDQELKQVLSTVGLISIRVAVSVSDAPRIKRGLEGLCTCRRNLSHVRGGDVTILSDRRTTRSSLATATTGFHSPLPLPLADLSSTCTSIDPHWVQDLEWVRDTVSHSVQTAFVPALDRLISTGSPLLKSQHGQEYLSMRSILQDSVHLEHFHVYSSPNHTQTSHDPREGHDRHVIDSALDFHTDAGLFLAFLPSMTCSPSMTADDDSFVIALPNDMMDPSYPDSERLVESNVIFPHNHGYYEELHVAIMLGEGAQNWLQLSDRHISLKATVHAVKMKSGLDRVWYGTMYLVPTHAIIQSVPVPYTLADMRRSMALAQSPHRVFQESELDSQSSIVIGCGITHRVTHTGSDLMAPPRHRLQMVNGPGDCSNTNNFYCWMTCQSLPDGATDIQDTNVKDHLTHGDSLYCVDKKIFLTTSNLSSAVESCRDPVTGVHGGAMEYSCSPQWHSTVSGVYFLLSNTSNATQSSHPKYCYGGTTMFMTGFVWEDSNCVIYLFRSWVITSRGLLALACIGTIVAGVLLEGIAWSRRNYLLPRLLSQTKDTVGRKWMVNKKIVVISSGFAYGTQLLLGYLLMLVVMTYSGPLIISVVIGLVFGNMLLTSMIMSRKTTPQTSDKSNENTIIEESDGLTPCCDCGI